MSCVTLIAAVQTTFASQPGGVLLQVVVTISQLSYEVTPLPETGIQILAQLGSLAGTVLVSGKIAMNWIERLTKRSTNSTNARQDHVDTQPQVNISKKKRALKSKTPADVEADKETEDIELDHHQA